MTMILIADDDGYAVAGEAGQYTTRERIWVLPVPRYSEWPGQRTSGNAGVRFTTE
jgi:hypothetical protein